VRRERIQRTRAGSPPSEIDGDDTDLVQRCAARDPAAWKELYDRAFPQVERLVAAIGVRDAEADDLYQEIFVIIHRHLGRFRGEARLSTWIARIAVREAIRFARRGRMRRRLAELFRRDRRALLPADWSESAASRRAYLRELLARLAPERRLALVLYEIDGLPVAEVARLTGCAENTVWTRLHRARADLERIAAEVER
jgi:RNA polymerase sigma-70 factor (ECF subfamily)